MRPGLSDGTNLSPYLASQCNLECIFWSSQMIDCPVLRFRCLTLLSLNARLILLPCVLLSLTARRASLCSICLSWILWNPAQSTCQLSY